MPAKIRLRIWFCCAAVCRLNCYKENVVIFLVVSLIFCNVRVVWRWSRKFLACVTKSKQGAFIKIKTMCGNMFPIIHTLLKEVCGNATLDRSTIQWQYKCFREERVSAEDSLWFDRPFAIIDNRSICYCHYCTRWRAMCNGKGGR